MTAKLTADTIALKCKFCGEDTDLPWGACIMCTGCRLDAQREPRYRLNPPGVLEAQAAKMRAYNPALTPEGYASPMPEIYVG